MEGSSLLVCFCFCCFISRLVLAGIKAELRALISWVKEKITGSRHHMVGSEEGSQLRLSTWPLLIRREDQLRKEELTVY